MVSHSYMYRRVMIPPPANVAYVVCFARSQLASGRRSRHCVVRCHAPATDSYQSDSQRIQVHSPARRGRDRGHGALLSAVLVTVLC